MPGRVGEFAVLVGVFIVNVKKIGTEATIIGALAATALGIASGVAGADQSIPGSPGVAWKLDRHGHDWDDWNHRGRDWRGGPEWAAPPAPCGAGYWVPPAVWQWVPPAAWGC